MPITEQEKQRRRALIEAGRQREEQERLAIPFSEAHRERVLGPLAPITRAAGTALEYPRHGITEGIQRFGEAREASRAGPAWQADLRAAWQLGREGLSDVADIAAKISPLGAGVGEWLDPSGETELGANLEALKQEFREREGRDPYTTELYDMKTQVQDVAMPWLTERRKWGPLEFSNRAMLELGVEVPAIAAEIALTGGAATLGRQALRAGATGAARIVKSQAGKSATRQAIAMASGSGLKGAAGAANQVLRTPLYVDRALGGILRWTVVKPVGFALKTAFIPPRLTVGGARMVLNHFRRTTADKGASMVDINKTASEGIDALTKKGWDVELEPGTEMAFKDLFEPNFDVPSTRQVDLGQEIVNSFLDPIYDGKLSDRQRLRDIVKKIIGAADSVHTEFRNKLGPRFSRMPRAPIPEEELFQVQIGRRVSAAHGVVEDQWVTRKESLITDSRTKTAFYINALDKMGMITWNAGGISGRALGQISSDMRIALESGRNIAGLIQNPRGAAAQMNGTVHLSDGTRMNGHVVVTDEDGIPIFYVNEATGEAAGKTIKTNRLGADQNPLHDAEGQAITDLVAVELDPAIDDIIRNIGLYKTMLQEETGVIRRVSLNNEGKIIELEGMSNSLNAYEVFEELAKLAKVMEDAAAAIESKIARSGRVSAGGSYFPSGVIGRVLRNGEFPRLDDPVWFDFSAKDVGRIVPTGHTRHRQYASVAEGQWVGQLYQHPAMAMESFAAYTAELVMAYKSGKFVSEVADFHNIPHSNIKTILGDEAVDAMNDNITKIKEALQVVMDRQRGLTGKKAGLLREEAKELLASVKKVQEIDDKFIPTEDGEVNQKLVDHVNNMNTNLLKWEREFTEVAQGLEANAPELRRLEGALKRAKDATKDYTDEAIKDLKSLSGIGIENLYFPAAFRKAILDSSIARSQMENPGKFARFNSALRIMGATGDMSAIGIQGWIGVMNDALEVSGLARQLDAVSGVVLTKAQRKKPAMLALMASWEALRNSGDIIVGEYMWRMEQIAKQTGSLGPAELANQGLAILKNAPDLAITPRLRNLPGIRHVDAAFTHYGNVFRVEGATMAIDWERLRTGKSIAELIADGSVAELMKVHNFMSGVGRRGFLGDFGQFMLFAPRFMHARIRMLTLAAQGSLPYGTKTVQQQFAARYLGRMFGTAAYLTFVINETLGEETDINPFIRNKATGKFYFNPNFMRIHAGSIDVSLLGPWDSMLRIMALPAFITVNMTQTGIKAWEDVRNALSAPGTSLIFDLFAGQDALGRSTRPRLKEDASTWDRIVAGAAFLGDQMMEHLTPFAWGDIAFGRPGEPSVIERATGGIGKFGDDPLAATGEVATAIGQTALQFLGVKSSYESINETLNEAYADILENMTTEQKLEAYGVVTGAMTEEEMDAEWARVGHRWWKGIIEMGDDYRVSVSFFGRLGDPVPKWEEVANDIQKNIKRMISENTFAEHMTAGEKLALEERITARREASAGQYDQYKLERENIERRELGVLEAIEEGFLGMQTDFEAREISYDVMEMDEKTKEIVTRKETVVLDPADIEKYFKLVRDVRRRFSTLKRNLTNPGIIDDQGNRSGEGKFYGVVDALFADQESRLGSEWDVDIYDAASHLYYDSLYKQTDAGPSIISPTTGIIDWNMRDKKVTEWSDQMAKDFPHLSEGRITRYLWRIEDSTVKDAPPLTGALFEMQKYISRAPMIDGKYTYYELDEPSLQRVIRNSPRASEQLVRTMYEDYKAAIDTNIKKDINAEAQKNGIYSLSHVDANREEQLDMYFGMRDEAAMRLRPGSTDRKLQEELRGLLEGMLVLLGKRGTVDRNPPTTRRGREVRAILTRHSRKGAGGKAIEDMSKFILDVQEGRPLGEYLLQRGDIVTPRTETTPGRIN